MNGDTEQSPTTGAGRPTKYSAEMIEKAQNYFENFEAEGDQIPSNAGLALCIGLSRQTIQVWGKEEGKEEFSYILDQIQAKQENLLINKGLTGDFNSNIAKLILGKHGYHAKQDHELSGELNIKKIENVIIDPANPSS